MKRVGLFVGIDKYKHGITSLECAVNDAKALDREFTKAQFETDSLLNEEAHCETILTRIEEMVRNLNPGDLFLFYFSGHGREIGEKHYLLGPTARPGKVFYQRGSLSISELISISDKPGINRLFILDCCRRNILSDRGDGFSSGNARDIALNCAVKQNKNQAIIPPLILNSCSTGEKAFEDVEKTRHGYFTNALLKSIRDPAIRSFCQFQKSLKISNTPEPQNICWNGNLSHWENICLLKSWNPSPPQPPLPDPAEEKNRKGDFCYGLEKFSEAFKFYKEAAEKGLAEAQYKLGYCFFCGQGIGQDYRKAVKWFREAAIQLYPKAMTILAYCYENGYGVGQDKETAVSWYRDAAKQNDPRAQCYLGDCYYHGVGVDQSFEEAVQWYQKAADNDYAKAMYRLGICYKKGHGLKQDSEEALKQFRAAAEKGYAKAEEHLKNSAAV